MDAAAVLDTALRTVAPIALLVGAGAAARGAFALVAVSTVFGRLAFLGIPFVAFALPGLGGLERTIVALLSGMPVAVSLLVLSERCDFHRETVASPVLASSAGSAVTLDLWPALLA